MSVGDNGLERYCSMEPILQKDCLIASGPLLDSHLVSKEDESQTEFGEKRWSIRYSVKMKG